MFSADAWKDTQRDIEASRNGKEARKILSEYVARHRSAGLWDSIAIWHNAIHACTSAVLYSPETDWNEGLRASYKQGSASREDVRLAIFTVLDYLGLYGNEAKMAMLRRLPESYLDDEADPFQLTGLLLLLNDALDECGSPESFSPAEAPHHYRLGPLQLPSSLTLTKRLPDPRFTGLAFQLEAMFRLFKKGRRLDVGCAMPEDAEGAFDVTTAFIRASIDPSAKPKEVRDRLNKQLKDHPGITWQGWPLQLGRILPAKTNVIRKRRSAKR
ncbi:hypothetical protein [Thiorhodococcus minor]|uniref:Uncharacterized protein n=1 Tax=Thiorhodococcus minor TaxID=57489 RepID=A0A6M0JYZ6_9GAMM|nr:hypothetical protein [Thiorhodococcus minor]NEV62271.1 hypothetical protein [Thiorhodococcus minor]